MEKEEIMVMNQLDSSSSNSKQKRGQASFSFASHAGAAVVGAGIGYASAWVIEPYYREYTEEMTSETDKSNSVAETSPKESVTTTIAHDFIVLGEHLQVAHVDNSLSFSQAFAQARAQVGPGGVFAWHGKVYGTYYENEWDSMSAEEHAAWRSKVDYNEALEGNDYYSSTEQSLSSSLSNCVQSEEDMTCDNHQEHSTPDSSEIIVDDNEVHVIGIAVRCNRQGVIATIGSLQQGDEMAVVVDVESDGRLDILAKDMNNDGQFEENEVLDIRADGKSTAAIVDSFVEEAFHQFEKPVVTEIDTDETFPLEPPVNDGMILPSSDEMLSNMNDADMGMMEV